MNNAMHAALGSFLYGFGASAVILSALVGAVYLLYRKSKKVSSDDIKENSVPKWLEDAERVAVSETAAVKEPVSFGYALQSVAGVSAVALAVGVFVYAWTIGISSYDGTVEKKHSGKGYRLQIRNYYIAVQGKSYTIGESLYENVRKGDSVSRPFCAPWTYVNGKAFVYSFALTVFGAFCGLLAVLAGIINILIWLSYRDSHSMSSPHTQ